MAPEEQIRADERERIGQLIHQWAIYWLLEGRSQHWDAADSLGWIVRSGEEPPTGEGAPVEEDRARKWQQMGYGNRSPNPRDDSG